MHSHNDHVKGLTYFICLKEGWISQFALETVMHLYFSISHYLYLYQVCPQKYLHSDWEIYNSLKASYKRPPCSEQFFLNSSIVKKHSSGPVKSSFPGSYSPGILYRPQAHLSQLCTWAFVQVKGDHIIQSAPDSASSESETSSKWYELMDNSKIKRTTD